MKFNLPSASRLFTDSERTIDTLSLAVLDEFAGHPFSVVMDADMHKLIDSIGNNGVYVPILVRMRDNGRYEIVSGHRRVFAAKQAGLTEIPAEIKDLSDDDAIIAMVDSNYHREQIRSSEKAAAYQMRYEAMKRQGKRNDLLVQHDGTSVEQGRSLDRMAEEVGESRETIRQYVKCAKLTDELKDYLDEGKINLITASHIAELPEEKQEIVREQLKENNHKLSKEDAVVLKTYKDFENEDFEKSCKKLFTGSNRKRLPDDEMIRLFGEHVTKEQCLMIKWDAEQLKKQLRHRGSHGGAIDFNGDSSGITFEGCDTVTWAWLEKKLNELSSVLAPSWTEDIIEIVTKYVRKPLYGEWHESVIAYVENALRYYQQEIKDE